MGVVDVVLAGDVSETTDAEASTTTTSDAIATFVTAQGNSSSSTASTTRSTRSASVRPAPQVGCSVRSIWW